MFQHPFSFEGRIGKTEYAIIFILNFVWNVICRAIDDQSPSTVSALIILIISLGLAWVVLAEGAKRCHDYGRSGWYQLIPFYCFVMLFKKGDLGSNEYGESPM